MNYAISRSVGYICLTAIVIMGLRECGTRVDPGEVKAVSEACAKVGKEPDIEITTSRIRMSCSGVTPRPAPQ